jgi:hypothetical protein
MQFSVKLIFRWAFLSQQTCINLIKVIALFCCTWSLIGKKNHHNFKTDQLLMNVMMMKAIREPSQHLFKSSFDLLAIKSINDSMLTRQRQRVSSFSCRWRFLYCAIQHLIRFLYLISLFAENFRFLFSNVFAKIAVHFWLKPNFSTNDVDCWYWI